MILVVAEQRDGALNRASWEAAAAAQQMGGPVKIVVLGAGLVRLRASSPRPTSRRSSPSNTRP